MNANSLSSYGKYLFVWGLNIVGCSSSIAEKKSCTAFPAVAEGTGELVEADEGRGGTAGRLGRTGGLDVLRVLECRLREGRGINPCVSVGVPGCRGLSRRSQRAVRWTVAKRTMFFGHQQFRLFDIA